MSETRGLWAFARGSELSDDERAVLDETLKTLGIDRRAYQPFIEGKLLDIDGPSSQPQRNVDGEAVVPEQPPALSSSHPA